VKSNTPEASKPGGGGLLWGIGERGKQNPGQGKKLLGIHCAVREGDQEGGVLKRGRD